MAFSSQKDTENIWTWCLQLRSVHIYSLRHRTQVMSNHSREPLSKAHWDSMQTKIYSSNVPYTMEQNLLVSNCRDKSMKHPSLLGRLSSILAWSDWDHVWFDQNTLQPKLISQPGIICAQFVDAKEARLWCFFWDEPLFPQEGQICL